MIFILSIFSIVLQLHVFIIIFKIPEFSSGVASTKLEQHVGHIRFHLFVLTECIVLWNIPAFSPISALARPHQMESVPSNCFRVNATFLSPHGNFGQQCFF